MMPNEILQILLFDASIAYVQPISDALGLDAHLKHVETLAELQYALKTGEWNAILGLYPVSQEAVQTIEWKIPFIVLCEPPDEDEAFELIDAGIVDVLCLTRLKHLPHLLRRELKRHALHLQSRDNEISERMEYEASLKRSEARFRSVIEGFNDIILMADGYQIIRYTNAVLKSNIGYQTSAVIGQPFSKFLHHAERDLIEIELASILSALGSTRTLEHRLLTAADRWEIAETTAQSLADPMGQPMLVLQIHIITKRKQAAEALKRYAQRMEILHQIDIGIIQATSLETTVDVVLKNLHPLIPFDWARVALIDPQQTEAVIFAADDQFLAAGVGTHIPLPPGIFEAFDTTNVRVIDNLPAEYEKHPIYGVLIQEGLCSVMQALLVGPTGTVGILGLAMKSQNFFTAEHQDIVGEIANQLAISVHQIQLSEEIKRHQDQLEQLVDQRTAELSRTKEQVEAILDNSTDCILLIDADLLIQQTNAACNRVLAYGNFIGKSLLDFMHSDDVEHVRTTLQTRIKALSGKAVEGRFIRHDHTFFEAEFSIGYISATSRSFVCTIRDITERKDLEISLRDALAKEKELGELKSRFVSMASHEFRTPLATILALTETLIAYRHKLPEEQIEIRLRKVQDQVEHLKAVMEDVLLLARMQARRVEFAPVKLNLDDLCGSVIDEFQSRPDVARRLMYSCDQRLHKVTLDKKLMRQIINNLVSNAIKYSPPDKPITINLAYENEELVFKVQDEGIGIPEADLQHLFEPFHRAANVGTIAGTGLGMVITKESVDMHGGTITVVSQVGIGTTFTVNIPLIYENKAKS